MSQEKYKVRPECPFCGEQWTDAMIDQYDSMTDDSICGCGIDHGPHDHHAHQEPPKPLAPPSDLNCAHCERAIYLAPASYMS